MVTCCFSVSRPTDNKLQQKLGFFIFNHKTYHLQWISFPPQGAKIDTRMIWINQDVFKNHVFFSHINFEVVHLSKSIQKYKLHIDLLVIQSKNTRVFEILPKPGIKSLHSAKALVENLPLFCSIPQRFCSQRRQIFLLLFP